MPDASTDAASNPPLPTLRHALSRPDQSDAGLRLVRLGTCGINLAEIVTWEEIGATVKTWHTDGSERDWEDAEAEALRWFLRTRLPSIVPAVGAGAGNEPMVGGPSPALPPGEEAPGPAYEPWMGRLGLNTLISDKSPTFAGARVCVGVVLQEIDAGDEPLALHRDLTPDDLDAVTAWLGWRWRFPDLTDREALHVLARLKAEQSKGNGSGGAVQHFGLTGVHPGPPIARDAEAPSFTLGPPVTAGRDVRRFPDPDAFQEFEGHHER